MDDTEGHQFAALRIDLSGLKSTGCEVIAISEMGLSRDVLAARAVESGCPAMNNQCAAVALDRPHPFASLRDARARSSTGQSIGLRIRGLGVQVPPGAPLHPLNNQDGINRVSAAYNRVQLIYLALSRGLPPTNAA